MCRRRKQNLLGYAYPFCKTSIIRMAVILNMNPNDEVEAQRRVDEAIATGATKIDLSGLVIQRLPANISSIANLEEIDIRSCPSLIDIWPVIHSRKLRVLLCGREISDAYKSSEKYILEDIRPIKYLCNLEVLHLHGCNSISDFSPLQDGSVAQSERPSARRLTR